LSSGPAKRALVAAMAEAMRTDLTRDGLSEDNLGARLSASDALLGTAPLLIVPWLSFDRATDFADAERAHAEKEMFLLSAGAAIQSLLLALHAQGLASCWTASSIYCQDETRAALGMPQGWFALGVVAVGRMPEGEAPWPRPPVDPGDFLGWR
jgi:coenzyme F420-0:L-glutamate ligase/coenzyme F420-1:gamma-L-glutamate ligase